MQRKQNTTKIIFILYVFMLLWLVLFKMALSFDQILLLQSARSVNVIPFYYSTDVGRIHTREVVLNVLAFVPMGVYLQMLTIPSKKAILYGCASSLALEVCQFVFAIGASDITDMITNTLGTAVGVCLYVVFRKLFSDKQKADRIINRIASVVLVLFGILTLLLFFSNRQ